jgi:hypothetical protein
MTEHHGLTLAPIFIVDLYSVFRCDVAHIHYLPRFNSDKPSAALGQSMQSSIPFLKAITRDRLIQDVHLGDDQAANDTCALIP